MFKDRRRMLENEKYLKSDINEEMGDYDDLPKEDKGFLNSIKSFFANLFTLGIYGFVKRKQLLKKKMLMLEKAEQEAKEKGTVEKITKEELNQEKNEAKKESEETKTEQTDSKNKTESINKKESSAESQLGE